MLEKEPKVYVFKQLPGWVDDSSVRVSASAGRILDVRVSRRYLARATEASYQKAEAESREAYALLVPAAGLKDSCEAESPSID